MIQLLITLLIIGLIVGLIWWVCDYLPVPEPLNKIIKIVSIVIGIVCIAVMLANLAGYNTGFLR